MKNYIKELRNKFKKYEIDGYVIPKNDDYFTEYSKLNRLEIISNFSGSAGLAIILKNKNYLFTDGRYTIQSKIESGKNFKIDKTYMGVIKDRIVECKEYKGNMSATKREEVCSHLRYIRLELREMHQMLIKEDLLPDLNEAKEVLAQLDALLDLLSEKKVTKIKSQF